MACGDATNINNPSFLIRKVAELMNNNISSYHIERHCILIKEFVKNSEYGYWLLDIPHIITVLYKLCDRLPDVQEYRISLEDILDLCYIPPMCTKASEVLEKSRDIQEYFSMLGYLMVSLPEDYLKIKVAEIIYSLLKRPNPLPKCCATKISCLKSAKKSSLPMILGQLFYKADGDLFEYIIKHCIILSQEYEPFCKIFLLQNVLNNIFIRLEPTWKCRFLSKVEPKTPDAKCVVVYYESVNELAWILLKYLEQKRDLIPLVKKPTLFALWSLRYTLRLFVIQNIKPVDRNNILALIVQILDLFPEIKFASSGLAYDIVTLNIACDMKTKEYWCSNIKVSSCLVDFEFRRFLLLALSYFPRYQTACRILEQDKIICSLLTNLRCSQRVQWDPLLHCNIVNCIINVLRKILSPQTDSLREDFIENNGPRLLALLLNSQVNSPDPDQNLLNSCLELIKYFLYHNWKCIINSLIFHAKTDFFIEVVKQFVDSNILKLDIQKNLAILFRMLSKFVNFTKVYYYDLPQIAIIYMKRVLKPRSLDPLTDPSTILCCFTFVWDTILNSETATELFLKDGGIYLMLDIIEKHSLPVKILGLGVLADFCQHSKTIPFLITWRGNRHKIISLLMSIFREENEKLGVKTGHHGEIIDVENPIMGKQQYLETYCCCPDRKFGNPCISDLFLSSRPKIYAILQFINEIHKDVTQIANEHYKLYNDDLSDIDKITMSLAENFLALKMGEAWSELKIELEKVNIIPIEADRILVQTLTHKMHKWGTHLLYTQQEVLKKKHKLELVEEYKYYNELKETKLSKALEALKEMKYVAKCSEKLFRLSNKMLQRENINTQTMDGRKESKGGPRKTFMHDCKVTNVYNQNIEIDCYIEKKYGVEKCLAEVSPCNSNQDLDSDVSQSDLEVPKYLQ